MVLFFVRHFNDIDHLVPVAWKLNSDGHPVAVYCMNHHYDIETDYRLQFLQTLDIPVAHLFKAFGRPRDPLFKALSFLSQKGVYLQNKLDPQSQEIHAGFFKVFGKFSGFMGKLAYKLQSKLYFHTSWARSILVRSKAQAICFDYVMPNLYFVDIFMCAASKMSIPIIALPHGIQLYTNEESRPKSTQSRRFVKFNRFDYVIAPNRLRKDFLINSGIDETKVQVLGSARYCHEWLCQNQKILPGKIKAINNQAGKLRVVLMLSRPHGRHDTERILSTSAMLAELDAAHTVIKPHTRSKGHQDLLTDITLTDVSEIPSAELLEWADVLLVVASSLILETLTLGKPALYLKYLHPNTTLFEEMGACWTIHDEAELKKALLTLCADKTNVPYSKENVDKFLTEVVCGGDQNREVLDAYENFILGCATADRS